MTGEVPLLVIIGPTASGKSSLAMSLAKSTGAEILSVDSMQVYRGMDIGTAKPTPEERQQVPHHLLDIVAPDESFSVARFVAAADEVIADAARRGVRLIATGGTPLYFKALFRGLFDGPSADASVREKLAEHANDELHRQLQQVDSAAAERIHVGDRKRLIRALEVHALTGQTISSLQNQWTDEAPVRHKAVWIGLKWEKEALNRRINARVGQMMQEGWPLEVRKLLNDYPNLSKTAAEATGYAELINHLHGKLDLDEVCEEIKIATRQLARRQMKWFRRFAKVHWIAGDLPMEKIAEESLKLWNQEI
jgi:tRNA dimethylallyltransferase